MRNRKNYLLFFFAVVLCVTSCRKNEEGYNRLKGDKFSKLLTRNSGIWKISEIKREKYNGSSLETVVSATNAGTLQFYFDTDGLNAGIADYTWDGKSWSYHFGWSVLGAQARINMLVCCDPAGNLIDSYFFIHKNTKTEQIWYTHSKDAGNVTYKTTWTLSFCGDCKPSGSPGTNGKI